MNRERSIQISEMSEIKIAALRLGRERRGLAQGERAGGISGIRR
jgi:hypothetical protein